MNTFDNNPEQQLLNEFAVKKRPPIVYAILFGLVVLIIFFGGFAAWSELAPLESAAVTHGIVIVESKRKTIQHLEGGIIKELHIRDGSKVKKGDLLISLDDTQAKATLMLVQAQINELLASEARLVAERDEEKKIIWPERLLKQKDDPQIKKLFASQQEIFTTSRLTLSGQLKILNQRIGQIENEIESYKAQMVSQQEQLKYIREELKAVRYLDERRLVEKPRLYALQREEARLLGEYGEKKGAIARLEQKIGETKQQIITIQDSYLNDVLKQLNETQTKLADLLEREKKAADILDRTKIYAPQGGTVVGLKKHTIGGVVTAGADILEIVPSEDALVIEAQVSPLDIDVVHPGLVAKVQLTAYKRRSTPVLEGVVTRVSADSLQHPKTGQYYFIATIKVLPDQLETYKHLALYPGMPVQVMIITDKRSALDYFITPIKDSFSRAFREE